ncbi:hypothetical protein [Liquorilactobacillus hordei]|uniref:hypothetical protein n=1 Tax=Liquorilactobacillus hordei TaxID=468911 RepID=UPI0039EAF28F
MEWHNHSDLINRHAFLGASQHAWLNYDTNKLKQSYFNNLKKQEGTELHALASDCIKHRIKVAHFKKAFYLFVNDAIGFNMRSEQLLYYSPFIFGTADAILYDNGVLRIHDLKTGAIPVNKFSQLDIYSALFCLEYNVDPYKTTFVERLYQFNAFNEFLPSQDDISGIMHKIKEFNKVLSEME